MKIFKFQSLLCCFIFLGFNSFSIAKQTIRDCGPLPLTGSLDENCKIMPVVPPHMGNNVFRANSPFIDKSACPFECCKYGNWTTKSALDLTDSVNGKKIIAKLAAGEKIQSLTGEVHTFPNEVEVIRDHGIYKSGDIFYLLTYQGEGFYKVWFNNKILSEEILFPGFTEKYDFKNCNPKQDECWGKIKNLERNSTWWIKVKKANGKTGWTKQSKEFLGQDSCSQR